MRLKITQIIPGTLTAYGVDDSGEKHTVLGGALYYKETIKVEEIAGSSKTFILPQMNYKSIDVFSKHFDKDGLIEFNKLKEVKFKSKTLIRVYELDGYWVFPENIIKHHVEYLYQNNLIDKSKIKISNNGAPIAGRLPVYGINYISMLEQVLTKREPISSWFICEKEKNFDNGEYADLFVLGNFNEKDLQIQLWQILRKGNEVLYAHGLINSKTLKFNHFDLASHFVDPEDIPLFIYNKQRLNLLKKKKWIRIDGEVTEENVFNLIKLFFPLDHLVDEFKEQPVLKIP